MAVNEELVPDVWLNEGTNYVTLAKHSNGRDAIRAIIEVTKDANNNRSRVVVQNIQFRSDYAGTGTWTVNGRIGIYTVAENSPGEIISLAGFDYVDEWFQAPDSSSWVTLGYGKYAAFDVNHDSDGRKQINIYVGANTAPYELKLTGVNGSPAYIFYRDAVICQMPDIDRSVPSITASASVNSSGAVTLTASANESCGSWAYKIDNGEWNSLSGTGTSKSVTIPGMTGAHSFQVKATKSSNGITGYSNTVSTTTPTLSLSSTAVTTSGSLTVTVQYLPANTYIYLKYGNTVLASYRESSAQTSKVINLAAADLKALFEASGVTTQSSITVTASVDGYNYTAMSFTLSAGGNMNPTVGAPTGTIVQGSTVDSSLANVYIAGFSKAKIAASVTSGSGSSISSVTLDYGTASQSMSYNSSTGEYEATTSGPVTGDTVFTVTATDARGLTGSNTYSLTGVKSWTAPAITFDTNRTYRCDSSGAKQEGGPYVRVKVSVSYVTGISGNALKVLDFYVREDGTSVKHNLTSGTQSQAYPLGSARPDMAITVVVECQDKVGGLYTKELQLSGGRQDFAMANYHSTQAGGRLTALGIGKAPDPTMNAALYGSTVQLPLMGRLLVGDVEIQNYIGADIYDDVISSGLWSGDFLAHDETDPMAEFNKTAQFSISNFSGWSHIPSAVLSGAGWDGVRFMILTNQDVYALVIERYPVPGRIWYNNKRKDTIWFDFEWGPWKGHTPDIT